MGKVDDMRRLREQRAAESARPAPSTTGGAARPRPLRAVPAVALAPADAGAPAAGGAPVVPLHVAEEPAGEALCGHQSISGRSCTRERDHQKTGTKNHRYG